jgi:hypothetical protein
LQREIIDTSEIPAFTAITCKVFLNNVHLFLLEKDLLHE